MDSTDLLGSLRLERGDVGDNRQDIVFAQIGDHRLHQLGTRTDARKVLEIIELALEIARRATGQ